MSHTKRIRKYSAGEEDPATPFVDLSGFHSNYKSTIQVPQSFHKPRELTTPFEQFTRCTGCRVLFII